MSAGSDSRVCSPNLIDLSSGVVVFPRGLAGPERKAIAMLVEEVEKRTRIRWASSTTWPQTQVPVIAVGPVRALETFAGRYAGELSSGREADAPEGFQIQIKRDEQAPAVFVIGNDGRGVLFGVGHLLRALRMDQGSIALPADLNLTTAPRYRLRGHQLGNRDKNNTYCGWDLPQWEQYIRDLVVFGANAIELIPPRSDDQIDSVHFPRPPLETMVAISQIADDYGIDVWIWYPTMMDEDYSDPATVESALEERGEVFQALPRIDAVFVPGSDPGWVPPEHLMPFMEKQAELLLRYHPEAQTWVAPQGFSQEWMDEFIDMLERESPDWLTGVVFSPWIHMTPTQFRGLIPAKYPIRTYPDITHCFISQYPVPDWDVAYALTEGREPVNPRPVGQASIFRYSQPPSIGFVAYSEGSNDDANKCIWSSMGWEPDRKVIDILREYSRYFIGARYTDDFAHGLLALERNWEGPLVTNTGVYTTLQQFQTMEESASPRDLRNWRFLQALYRAYYDAYTRSRLLYETELEEQAISKLREAQRGGSLLVLDEAERILDLAANQPISNGWRTRIFQLAEALFQSIHMQLSVNLYQAQSEMRGANLDGIDYPLNSRPWLTERFGEIRGLGDEAERLHAIKRIVDWTNPGPGGFYDNLGQPFNQPHVVRGPGFERDPAFLKSAQIKYPYSKDPRALRLSWRGFTGCLNDTPFRMRYIDLDPCARYKVRLVYSDQDPKVGVRLDANEGIEIHPLIRKPTSRGPMEFDIPREATQGGRLTLTWYREQGRGGSGVGCEISEIWLIKE